MSEIPGQSVQRFETTGRVDRPGLSFPQIDRLLAIRNALEAAGVEFTNEDAPGVRLQGVSQTLNLRGPSNAKCAATKCLGEATAAG